MGESLCAVKVCARESSSASKMFVGYENLARNICVTEVWAVEVSCREIFARRNILADGKFVCGESFRAEKYLQEEVLSGEIYFVSGENVHSEKYLWGKFAKVGTRESLRVGKV